MLFPELSLSGFIPNHPPRRPRSVAAASARRGSPGSPRLVLAARRDACGRSPRGTGVLMSTGTLEDAGNVLYNTQLLVGPQACSGRGEKCTCRCSRCRFTTRGPGPRVEDTPLGRIGANICFDVLIARIDPLAGGAECRNRAAAVRGRSATADARRLGRLGRTSHSRPLRRKWRVRRGLQLRGARRVRRGRAGFSGRRHDRLAARPLAGRVDAPKPGQCGMVIADLRARRFAGSPRRTGVSVSVSPPGAVWSAGRASANRTASARVLAESRRWGNAWQLCQRQQSRVCRKWGCLR